MLEKRIKIMAELNKVILIGRLTKDPELRHNTDVGRIFGRLTVVKKDNSTNGGKTKLICICECGKTLSVLKSSLVTNKTKSCGCLRKEVCKNNCKTKHRMSNTRLFYIWSGMKSRCYYKNNVAYSSYGKRNISVCKEWKDNFVSFKDWALKNGYADNLTIDRIDNNGDYEPNNCRWATYTQQENNRSNNTKVTIGKETYTLAEWSRKIGICSATISNRLKSGWSDSELFIKPNFNNKNLRGYKNA